MKALFLMDVPELINVKADTTVILMLESQRRGHEIWMAHPNQLSITQGEVVVSSAQIEVRDEEDWFSEKDSKINRLSDFDLVWMRKDPPYNIPYVVYTHLLELVSEHTFIINHPAGLRNSNEKLSIMRFPELIPKSLVTLQTSEILKFVADCPDGAVVKPVDSFGGEGVFFLKEGDSNVNAILDEVTRRGTQHIIVQEFLKDVIEEGDKRIIVLDGKPIGALKRIPKEGEWRANLHMGGTGEKVEIDDHDRVICEKIAPYLKSQGLYFVGLDIISGKLTEINVTSPTCVREINQVSDVRLESEIVVWAEGKV